MNVTFVDAHPVMRVGMSLFLQEHFSTFRINLAEDIEKYADITETDCSDLVIMGLSEENYQVNCHIIHKLRMRNPQVGIIIVSGKAHHESAQAALVAGAKGYLLKTSDLTEMVVCINEVLNGKQYRCKEIAQPF